MRLRLHERWRRLAAVALAWVTLGLGCASWSPPRWAEVASGPQPAGAPLAYDTNGDGAADFWVRRDRAGRNVAVAHGAARPADWVALDEARTGDVPHLILVLDGVPYQVVADLYADGAFRFLHPPRRVICCYPGMTDLALADVFGGAPCESFQAQYYGRAAGRLVEGNDEYLAGANSPWLPRVDYRASLWWDVLVYLNPQAVFDHEMRAIEERFAQYVSGEMRAYSVGTAGLGTRGGRPAMEAYLRQIDRYCASVIKQRAGRVHITLLADHGHNMVENRNISFEQVLAAGGYRLTARLDDPRDVVTVRYGLCTYAELYTDDPAGVAACVLEHPDVVFACYPRGDAVVVHGPGGIAEIRAGAGGYRYDQITGDPLMLDRILAELRSAGHGNAAGEIDEDALFAATVNHVYPDPLARLWAAFFGVARHPPDVIVNLGDGACHGSRFFMAMVGTMASTHGSLNRVNSTTFVMTTAGELPSALRSAEVLPAIEALRTGAAGEDQPR